jgi:outer membrane protein assembly factor BamB
VCPDCGGDRIRGARWCGACGAALGTPASHDGHDTPRPATSSPAAASSPGRAPEGAQRLGSAGSEAAPDEATRCPARSRVGTWSLVVAAGALGLVAVAVTTGGLDGFADGPLAGPSTSSIEVDLDEDAAAAAAGSVTNRGPVCLRTPACVAWIEPASIAGRTPTATVVADLTLVRVRDGLEARDTADGTLRWRADLADAADRSTYLPVLAAPANRVALLTDEVDGTSTLAGVDLATGRVRWRLAGVAEVTAVREHDEVLLVQVVRTPAAAGEDARQTRDEQVLAVAADDGEVRWSTGGRLLQLVDDGVVVVASDAVLLRRPDGATGWRQDLTDGFAPAWIDVKGRFLRLFDGPGTPSPVISLADGEPLDLVGDLVPVADPHGTPGRPFRSDLAAVVDRHRDGTTELTLLEGTGETWRVTFERLGCCSPLQLQDDTLLVPASDGGRWVLDRADGSLVERTDPPTERPDAAGFRPSYDGVSLEEVDLTAATTTDLTLLDGGLRTARLPSGSWPVAVEDDVIVVRSHAWVAAIRRDEASEPE